MNDNDNDDAVNDAVAYYVRYLRSTMMCAHTQTKRDGRIEGGRGEEEEVNG